MSHVVLSALSNNAKYLDKERSYKNSRKEVNNYVFAMQPRFIGALPAVHAGGGGGAHS